MSSGMCCHGKPKKGGLHLIRELNIKPIKEGLTKLRYVIPNKGKYGCSEGEDSTSKSSLPNMGPCTSPETDLSPPIDLSVQPEELPVIDASPCCPAPAAKSTSKVQSPCNKVEKEPTGNSTETCNRGNDTSGRNNNSGKSNATCGKSNDACGNNKRSNGNNGKACNAPPPANNGKNGNNCNDDANLPDFNNPAVLQSYTENLRKANSGNCECQLPETNDCEEQKKIGSEECFCGTEYLSNKNDFGNIDAADCQLNMSGEMKNQAENFDFQLDNFPMGANNCNFTVNQMQTQQMFDINAGNYPMNLYENQMGINPGDPKLDNFNQPFYNFGNLPFENPLNTQQYQMQYTNEAGNMNFPMMQNNYFNTAMDTSYGMTPCNGGNDFIFDTDNQQQFMNYNQQQVMNNNQMSDDDSDVMRIQIYPPKICITFSGETSNTAS